jgi:hypothetical protein
MTTPSHSSRPPAKPSAVLRGVSLGLQGALWLLGLVLRLGSKPRPPPPEPADSCLLCRQSLGMHPRCLLCKAKHKQDGRE